MRLFVPLLVANVAAWGLGFAAFHHQSVLMGAAVLAYILGLRHALDPDHIAAIDNVTRKLMAKGARPHDTGLYFSLGHSAVVWLASMGIALAVAAGPSLQLLQKFGTWLGSGVSIFFLFAIAMANLLVLPGLLRALRQQRHGEMPSDDGITALQLPKGLYTRLLDPLLHLVSNSRHMLAIGFLFGLGFDTASEVGVLGLSAAAASKGMPVWFILIFPALFTAGMSLIDTLDSTLMTSAYGWAFVEPTRKLYYNLAITLLSIMVAILVGGLELLTWSGNSLFSHLPHMGAGTGLCIAAAFLMIWLASAFAFQCYQHTLRSSH